MQLRNKLLEGKTMYDAVQILIKMLCFRKYNSMKNNLSILEYRVKNFFMKIPQCIHKTV